MLTLLLVGLSAAVLSARERVAAWAITALSRSGVPEKALALDLGRDLGKLSHYFHDGTIQLADVLALPQAVRAPILEAACAEAGLPLLRPALRRAAQQLEAQLLAVFRSEDRQLALF